MNNSSLAYVLLRISMGINMLGHGLVRIPKLNAFADGMTKGFEKSWLPPSMVHLFGTVLPFLELLIGILLIIGLKTKLALIAGAVLVIVLLFGSSTVENWDGMGTQMIYALFFYFLLHKLENNKYSVDNKLIKQ